MCGVGGYKTLKRKAKARAEFLWSHFRVNERRRKRDFFPVFKPRRSKFSLSNVQEKHWNVTFTSVPYYTSVLGKIQRDGATSMYVCLDVKLFTACGFFLRWFLFLFFDHSFFWTLFWANRHSFVAFFWTHRCNQGLCSDCLYPFD